MILSTLFLTRGFRKNCGERIVQGYLPSDGRRLLFAVTLSQEENAKLVDTPCLLLVAFRKMILPPCLMQAFLGHSVPASDQSTTNPARPWPAVRDERVLKPHQPIRGVPGGGAALAGGQLECGPWAAPPPSLPPPAWIYFSSCKPEKAGRKGGGVFGCCFEAR